jgi:transcriptional regulator with XRE-family HTH domain
MIKNERQYRITKAQANKFREALDDVKNNPDKTLHPLLQTAQSDALRSQLQDLLMEVSEYEVLSEGKQASLNVDSFDDLPKALIKARIASGFTQKALAEAVGVKEQQIQRYEATEYAGASIDRLREIMRALKAVMRNDIFLAHADLSPAHFFGRLSGLGLEKEFLLEKILHPSVAAYFRTANDASRLRSAVLQAASTVGRVFHLSPANILGSGSLELPRDPCYTARFKISTAASVQKTSAYTVYAHTLSLLVLSATRTLTPQPVPTDPSVVRKHILDQYGSLSFENTLKYVWSLGIPVLPLADSGAFHGACWRVDGRNIIILKQINDSLARWLFDLIHELRHAGEDPQNPSLAVVEESETSQSRIDSIEEQTASQFAGDVILDGRAEELAHKCANESNGNIPQLKSVVPRVAKRENVPTDSLANYIAFRLSMEGQNWWGAANNLQQKGNSPFFIAKELLLRNLAFDQMAQPDLMLLQQALAP